MKSILCSGTILSILCACGGGGGGPAPLTKAQKKTFSSTLSSTTTAAKVTTDTTRKGKRPLLKQKAFRHTAEGPTVEPSYSTMSDYLYDKLGNCVVVDNLDELPDTDPSSADEMVVQMEKVKVRYKASGKDCPIFAT